MFHIKKILFIVICSMLLCACGKSEPEQNNDIGYTCITMEEAAKRFQTETDYILVDVRTHEEHDAGFIPEAICVPVDEIETEAVNLFEDKDQRLYIYCRSGNRSKKAAEKLVNLGFTNVVEIGGINDWQGDIHKVVNE